MKKRIEFNEKERNLVDFITGTVFGKAAVSIKVDDNKLRLEGTMFEKLNTYLEYIAKKKGFKNFEISGLSPFKTFFIIETKDGMFESFKPSEKKATRKKTPPIKRGINSLANEIYHNAVSKGFYENPKSNCEALALITCEVAEAIEADRKDKRCYSVESLKELSDRKGEEFEQEYKMNVKGSLEEEVADIFIRTLDFAKSIGMDLETHVELKMKINSTREYKHGKKY